jgi:O-antigen/teichoic acid export membrane protein
MANPSPQNTTAVKAEAVTPPIHGIARRLAQSFAVYGIANFGIRALNFILIVVYAHYLRPSDYGIIYLAEIIAAFLVMLQGLWMVSALQRLYFQHNHDAEELRGYLGSGIRFGFFWMTAILALVLLLGRNIQSHLGTRMSVPFYPYIAMAVTTATATLGVEYRLAVYQAARRPRSYAFLSSVLAVLTAACCMYGVVVRRGGAAGMLKGKLLAAFITFLIAVWSMRTFLTARFQWEFVRESLSYSLPLIPHLAMASGLIVADRFILEHYRDLSEVGIYSVAYTFGMVMYLVTQSLSQAWLPMFFELAGGQNENRQVLGRICSGIVIFLAAIACLGILLSPVFVHVALDYRYHAAARIVPLVIMGYLFHSLFSLFDFSILQAKRTASVFMISLVAFTVNLVLNFAMIPRWGMYGAAWATTIAYAVEAVGAFILAQRFFTLSYRVPEILAGIAVAGGALWLTQSAWMPSWQGPLLVSSAVLALGLLALIGRRDLQSAFMVIRNTRKREPQVAG